MPSEDPSVPAVITHDPQPSASPRRTEAPRRPNLTGDLDAMLANAPTFRSRVRGYDRLQVDNYVRWAETEILSARREVDDLATRYGLCVAEVDSLQQFVAQSPEGRQLHQVSKRIGDMLRLAAEEAAALRAASAEEAERALDEARTAAAELQRKAREIEEAAVAEADTLHTEARAAQAQADAALVQARAEATRLLDEASAERDRLTEQAATERSAAAAAAAGRLAAEEEKVKRARDAMLAEAAVQVAAMEDELADLGTQRDQARQCLSRLATQIGDALEALVEGLPRDVGVPQIAQNGPREHVLAGNVVARP